MADTTGKVSNTQAIVKVEKQVRICLVHDFTDIDSSVHFDFDLRLSRRGTDFKIYANTGYEEDARDSELLAAILKALVSPRSGLKYANVEACSLEVEFSAAVSTEEIIQRILDAAWAVGYEVNFWNKDAEKRARRGF